MSHGGWDGASPGGTGRDGPLRSPGRGRAGAIAALAAWVLVSGRPASAMVGDPNGAFGLGGSLRIVPALAFNHPVELPTWLTPDQRALLETALPEATAGMTQTLLRLTAVGASSPWLKYEAHLLQVVDTATSPGDGLGLGQSTGAGATTHYRLVGGAWRWRDTGSVGARLEVDRLSVKLALPSVDVTVGRQAITFGKAYFWNPLDVFLPFDPFQFDRDYKRGVDALRIDVAAGELAGVTLVGVLGRDAGGRSWYDSAVLGRVFAALGRSGSALGVWDATLQGGKVRGGYQVGGGLEGEVGAVELRGEATWFTPAGEAPLGRARGLPEAFTLVGGVGHRFESGLKLDAEYLFNGAGRLPLSESWPLVLAGDLLHTSRQVVGATAGYERGLLRGSLACLVSLSDGSAALQPGLTYSAADEVDVVGGAVMALGAHPSIEQQLPAGGGSPVPVLRYRSEFGSSPQLVYAEVKVYF